MRDCRVDAGCEGADLMTDEERIETAKRAGKRNAYAREHGVCVRCHKSFEPDGHTLCPECRDLFRRIKEGLKHGNRL